MPATSKATFIVRLWADGDPAEESSWRGEAELVGTAQQCRFRKLAEFVDWMRQQLSQIEPDSSSG